MENTLSTQFSNELPEFFLAEGQRPIGPFQAQEIYLKLERKESSWSDYIYRAKEGKWMRIFEHPVFQGLLPKSPAAPPVGSARPAPPEEERRCWFMINEDQQTGPYTATEVKRVLALAKGKGSLLWRSGMMEWLPADQAFQETPAELPRKEKRMALRRPITAKIFVTNQAEVILGVCRDLSVGGMQVLAEKLPGAVGTVIRLNVDPSHEMSLSGFVAEGVIVRHLEDMRGFSFRFTKISDHDREQIEQFIEQIKL